MRITPHIPEPVAAALSLRRTHPPAPPLDILDLCFEGSAVRPSELDGAHNDPCTPFGQLLAAAFDRGMEPGDWMMFSHPATLPAVRRVLESILVESVVTAFIARYSLSA